MGFTPDGGEMTLDISAEDNASGAIDGIAGSLGGMRTAAAAAGGAIAAIGIGGLAASASAATDFETAMVEVEKVTGATESQMDDFNDMVMEMSSEIPMAQEKLAGLTADAARFGIEGSENIRKFTETAAKMASATTLNAEEAGESLAKLGKLTGTPVSEMENLGSAINSLSNNAATSSQEIVDSMLRSSATLKQLGMNQTEIAGLSAAMNEMSETSRRAGSRLRRVGQEMMDPKKAEDLASGLGMTAEEFKTLRDESPTEAIRMMAETMKEGGEEADILRSTLSTTSRQAISGLSENLEGLDKNLARSNKSFEEGTSLQEEFQTEMDTFNAKVKTLKNRLRNVAIEIGTALMPALNAALDAVMPIIDGFAALNEKTDGLAGVAVLAGTAITGLATAFAALAPVITGTVLPALGSVAAVLTGPVGIAIAAVVAAVAGLKYAWDNNIGGIQQIVQKFSKRLKKIFNRIKGILKASKGPIDFVKNLFTEMAGVGDRTMADLEESFERVQATVERVINEIGNVINFFVNKLLKPTLQAMQRVWDRHFSAMMKEGKATFDAILGYISTAIDAVMRVINITLDIIVGLWNKYGDQIMAVVMPLFDTIKTIVAGTMDTIMTTIRVVMAIIRGDWSDAWNLIKGLFNRTVDRIMSILRNFKSSLTAAWGLLIDLLTDAWTAAWNFVKKTIKNAFNAIVSFITSIGKQDVYNAFKAVGSAVRTVIKGLVNAIIGAGGFIKSLFSRIVSYVKNGAKSDVKSAFKVLVGAVKTVFKNMVNAIIGAGGFIKGMIGDIASYLKNQAFEDLKEGAKKLVGAIRAAFEGLYDGLIGNSLVKDMIGDIAEYLKNAGKNLIEGAFEEIIDAVEDVFDTVIQGPDINWPEPPEIVKKVWNGNLDLSWPSPNNNQSNGSSDGDSGSSDGGGGSSGGGGGSSDGGSGSSGGDDDSSDGANRSGRQDERPRIEDDDSSGGSSGGGTDQPARGRPTGNTGGGGVVGGISDAVGGVVDKASEIIGGLSPFASGGIVTSPTAALIGEAGQNEAVIPLDQLNTMMDMTYDAGVSNATTSTSMDITISVEGDDELTRLIRENAEVVVEENDERKQDRLKRF